MIWEFSTLTPDKEDFTQLSQGDNLIEERGSYYGSLLVQIEKNNLIRLCISSASRIRTRKDWMTLDPYFSTAINELQHRGCEPGIILVPHNLRYEFFQNLPGFETSCTGSDSILGLRGYYQGIPIMDYRFSDIEPILLFGDITKALQFDIEEPIIEVKALSSVERTRILVKKPEVEEKKLLISVHIKNRRKGSSYLVRSTFSSQTSFKIAR